jgi:hypothetical protein
MTDTRARFAIGSGLLAAAVALAGCGSSADGDGQHGGRGGAAMSCAAPVFDISPRTVRAGDPVSVHGRWFVANCADTVVNGVRDAEVPIDEVRLRLTAADHEYPLATVHPDATGAFDVTVTLPADVQPGPATLDDAGGHGQPLPLTISR